MSYVIEALRNHPELAIFLTVALGFLLGRLKIGSFTLGSVVGTLLAGVLVGQLDIQVPGVVKAVFFDLFLFATGYKVGPQFFRGLKKNALSQVALTVVLCVTCLLTAFTAAKLMGYDRGTAAGLLAGAFTESTVIGTAGDAIQRLDIPAEQKAAETNNIPVAYAVTYLVGTGFVVWFLSNLAPRLIKVNLKEESRKMAAQGAGGLSTEEGSQSAYRPWQFRAYRVSAPGLSGRTIADLEGLFPGERVFIERFRRGTDILEAELGSVLREGDIVAIMARREPILRAPELIGPEQEDRELLDIPASTLDVVVTNRALVDLSLADLGRLHGRGVALQKLVREGEEMPFTGDTAINRGDILQVVGSVNNVERLAKVLGYAERGTSATDMIFVGTGIVLGGLVGLLSVTVGGLPLTLTSSGGALIMGLVFGWLRSVRPTFGRIPEPALWIFDTVGLVVFIGIVGLDAGPSFASGLQKTGISLVFVGLVVAVLPHVVAILFGRYVLKMDPVTLLGACSGAGTNTAALRAIQDEAQSRLPALGYTVPYAVGNILLTAWGPVIVALLSR
jgi:putative transport protein